MATLDYALLVVWRTIAPQRGHLFLSGRKTLR